MPNITGQFSLAYGNVGFVYDYSGAYTCDKDNNLYAPLSTADTGSKDREGTLYFKASNSNAIYGKSSTVQPPALTLLPIIKAL